MNERIKELAEQSGLVLDGEHWFSAIQQADVRNIDLERFAELIRADQREIDAKLAETTCCKCMDTAEAIRQRSDNEPS